MARLFLAIDLPSPVKAELAALQGELARAGGDVRWVRPQGMHVTLKFLGEVPLSSISRLVETVRDTVARAGVSPFRLTVQGLGTFPPGRRARVVWAGLAGQVDALGRLKRALEEGLSPLGFEVERRPFVPHVTLGRVKSSRRLGELLAELDRREGFSLEEVVEAREVVLYQSQLRPSGAVYTALHRFPLEG